MKFLILGVVGLGYVHAQANCGEGKVTNSQNFCIQPDYIDGCLQYKTSRHCSRCQPNYQLQDGLCVQNADGNSIECLEKDLNQNCIRCPQGTTPTEKTCSNISIMGCIQKDYQAGTCLNCSADFVLRNGKCQQGIKGCIKYSTLNTEICQQCAPFHSFINNACLENVIMGCEREQQDVCLKCFKPFQKSEGHCEIQNCRTYNEFGCIACHCGYYITQTRQCKPYAAGCLKYSREKCVECLDHFTLKGTQCVLEGCTTMSGTQCLQCEDNYQLQEGSCKVNNCLEWKDGVCLVCEKGYSPNQGQCVQITQTVAQ